MRRFLPVVAIAGALCPSGGARAQVPPPVIVTSPSAPRPKPVDPVTYGVARQIVAAVHTDQTLDRMMIQFAPVFGTTIVNSLLANPATMASTRHLIDVGTGGRPKLEAIFAQEFMASARRTYPQIEDSAAREYASRFSADELRTVLAFYGSGVGAKVLSLMPDIQSAMFAEGRALGANAGKEAGVRGVVRAQQEMVGTPVEPKS